MPTNVYRIKPQVHLFYEDEATFGRTPELKNCWCPSKVRPDVPKQHVREYLTVYGATNPFDGEFFYMITRKEKPPPRKKGRRKKGEPPPPKIEKNKGFKSEQMNEFMKRLSEKYPNDQIVFVCDNAGWHKSQYIKAPSNIHMIFIPPYTPEMNPQEQVWRELRTKGFNNKYFTTLKAVEETLIKTIESIPASKYISITQQTWLSCS